MSTIEISRTHNLSSAVCKDALDELSGYLRSEFSADVQRQASSVRFKGRGFEGEVEIKPGTASGRIKLGLLARPFKKHLETEINRQLDARLSVE